MRKTEDAEDPTKKRKIPWKHFRRDGWLKAQQRKQNERAYRMTREVAKALRIPLVA